MAGMAGTPYIVTVHVDFGVLANGPQEAYKMVADALASLQPDVIVGDLGHHAEVWEDSPKGPRNEVIIPIEPNLATYHKD